MVGVVEGYFAFFEDVDGVSDFKWCVKDFFF